MSQVENPCASIQITAQDLEKQKPIQKLVASCARGDANARAKLTEMDVLRTKGGPMGNYAEWLMEQLFSLKRASVPNQQGWDAKDEHGRRYQIKARPRIRSGLSWDHNMHPGFDYLLAMVLNEVTFDLLLLLCVSYEDFCELCSGTLSDCRLRWNHQTRSDPRIKVIYSVPW